MRLTREQRAELKRRLRRAPQYTTATKGAVALGQIPVAGLIALAREWSVPIPTLDDVTAARVAAVDPAAAFDDLDEIGTPDLLSRTAPAPTPTVSSADVPTAEAILAKLGQGDFAGFQADIAALHTAAIKPPVEVERIVERVVEIEVEAVSAHLRPDHQPRIVGTTRLHKLDLDQWDAPDAPAVDALYQWPGAARVALTKIKRGQPIFLAGPAGTGKTSLAEQIAAHQRRPVVRISCHEQTDGPTLVGMMVPEPGGGVRWQDGQLTRALRRAGTLILIDEPSTARPGAMMILQSVLEPGGKLHIETTGEVVRRATGVSFVVADNTSGHGDETGQYEATRRMNRATLDRMAATLLIDYLPRQSEIRVLKDRTGLADAAASVLVSFANVSRDGALKGALTHGIGLRRLLSWAEAIVDGIDPAEGFAACVLNAAAPDDREPLRQLYAVHVGNKIS